MRKIRNVKTEDILAIMIIFTACVCIMRGTLTEGVTAIVGMVLGYYYSESKKKGGGKQ